MRKREITGKWQKYGRKRRESTRNHGVGNKERNGREKSREKRRQGERETNNSMVTER